MNLDDLQRRFVDRVRLADAVIVGSYVPEGVAVGDWVLDTAHGLAAFYDIDTPVTLANLERNNFEYLAPRQIPRYALYLSFTGGHVLDCLERQYGSPMRRKLYCSVDPDLYRPQSLETVWDLGYLGTYSDDRQPMLECLLIEPAKRWPEGRFVVAGPQYPSSIVWPPNVERITHLAPAEHPAFYNRQRFTLNITRTAMARAGYCPSVRLFEASACASPIISDTWKGLDEMFEPDSEILLAQAPEDVLHILQETDDPRRRAIGHRASLRVLAHHTAAHRAEELEALISDQIRNYPAASPALRTS